VLVSLLLPTIARARDAAVQVHCSSNLRQIGVALHAYVIEHRRLPERPAGLDQMNPHVFKYKSQPADISPLMQDYAGSRDVYYCPANYEQRTPARWWPYGSGTVAATYQFPFLLKHSLWLIPCPDYRRLTPDRVLAADYLGTDTTPDRPLAWNHRRCANGEPVGMSMLFGDGHVLWRDRSYGWVLYGRSGGPIDWYWAKY
jgi:hypothetical protein